MKLAEARFMTRLGAALASACALIMAAVLAWHRGITLTIPAELALFVAFVVGGSGLLVAWIGWRALRLSNPDRAIARWRVGEVDWRRFREACRMREGMAGALPGSVALDLQVPVQGIEVIALPKGFTVGDTFHELGTLGAELIDARVVDSPVPMLEFNVIYATGKTSSVRRGVRIPLAGGETWTRLVEDHWLAREPLLKLSTQDLLLRERAGFRLAMGGLVLLLVIIVGFVYAQPPAWAALAPIAATGLACLGFFRGLRARSVRMRRGECPIRGG
ncbi:MAG: hypothetical protein E6R11_00370 [Rhodocyclaceae bacterium]|nr:MAG: hypothetical protein E6R11_00370 [Rhodocyclaceae bacterium]